MKMAHCARCAYMADCNGPFLSCARYWGCQREGRQLKTPDSSEKPESSARNGAKFIGTDNPRHLTLRAIAALLRRPMPGESLEKEAGASNSPELIAEVRRRGLDAPCERIRSIGRDDCPCCASVYDFTARGRRRLYAWMAERGKRGQCG